MRKEERISVMKACRILELSRSSYYRKVFDMKDYRERKRESSFDLGPKVSQIKEISVNNEEYGYRKIWALANYRYGVDVSRHQTYKVLKELNLLLPSNFTKKLREESKARSEYIHKPFGINQLWQADFCQFEIPDYGTYYATNVQDYYSKYVLCTLVRESHTADDLIDALDQAQEEAIKLLGEGSFPYGLVLVTDNGPQMRSRDFRKYKSESIFIHIYTRRRHPETIGMLERFNESQKYERIYRREYRDPLEAITDLEQYRKKYNFYRPHQALEYRTPSESFKIENLADDPFWVTRKKIAEKSECLDMNEAEKIAQRASERGIFHE